MTDKKNEAGNLLPMVVTEGVTVNVMPNKRHEYLMTTKEVAFGYGTTKYSIFQAFHNHQNELLEGKHFIRGVDILSTPTNKGVCRVLQPKTILFTKRGIVRLGFFVKSDRAKLFRDWAEELIINVSDHLPDVRKTIGYGKTKANQLTQERLIDIMADVCQIDDKELRLSIASKLLGKGVKDGAL